ncbi:MAG TPA: hypothetical protein DD624_05645 [Alphaproteobacteria bacterium]|mgnify:FL=1|nr:hypothetical protein [Alphaproteobacteria bacterium]
MKISIIIPIYNAEKYLTGCLNSIAAQTYPDFECWCVNNGSTDNSPQIIAAFVQKDARFKCIDRTNAGKQAAARNAALKRATGDAVTFVDADDYIHPRMLELLVKTMNETRCGIVGCGIETTSKTYDSVFEKTVRPDPVFRLNPLRSLWEKPKTDIGSCAKLYKKSVLNGLRFIEGVYFEDVPWTLFCMNRTERYAFVNVPLYFYYQSADSTMRSDWTDEKTRSYADVINFIAENFDVFPPPAVKDIKKHIIGRGVKLALNKIRKSGNKNDLLPKAAELFVPIYKSGLFPLSALSIKTKIMFFKMMFIKRK